VFARSEHGEALLEATVSVSPPRDGPEVAVRALLAQEGFGDDLFHARQHACCVAIDQYVTTCAANLLDELDLAPMLAHPATAAELIARGQLAPGFTASLRWLLDLLVDAHHLARLDADGTPRYRHRACGVVEPRESIRARALALDESYRPAYALIDAATRAYVLAARNTGDPDAALLRRLDLWAAYFSNTNAYYALNNRVAARAASRALAPRAAPRILEVGAGMGSASVALLEALRERQITPATYTITEPVDIFRRRAERTTAAFVDTVPLRFAPFDLDQPPEPQGISPASVDLVWGVNVFHVASDLDTTLANLRTVLVPGGQIVIGEGIRPAPHTPVPAEFPFRLLRSWQAVTLDPERRPEPGFLTADRWIAQLEHAGFTDIHLVPDTTRLSAIQPRAYPAAIVARSIQ
jgi:SAM-dependent methyltransferase